jgi:CHAT domain-containing protein
MKWLIGSAETTLNEQKINNLLFVMPTGLRIIPIAALIDSEGQFLVKKYSSGFAPSISLNNNAYKDIRQQQLLALGCFRIRRY